jgi:hypothetical protein
LSEVLRQRGKFEGIDTITVIWYSIFRITHLTEGARSPAMKRIFVFVALMFVLGAVTSTFAQAAPPTQGEMIVYLTQQGPHQGELAGWHLHFTLSTPTRPSLKTWIVTAKRRGARTACYGVLSSRNAGISMMIAKTLRTTEPRSCTSDFATTFNNWLAIN